MSAQNLPLPPGLPAFGVDGMRSVKRLNLLVRDGAIQHVLYPACPPGRSAATAAARLRANPA